MTIDKNTGRMITGMREVEIIPIARRKLEKRRIPEDWVRETLNLPSQQVMRYWKEDKDED